MVEVPPCEGCVSPDKLGEATGYYARLHRGLTATEEGASACAREWEGTDIATEAATRAQIAGEVRALIATGAELAVLWPCDPQAAKTCGRLVCMDALGTKIEQAGLDKAAESDV